MLDGVCDEKRSAAPRAAERGIRVIIFSVRLSLSQCTYLYLTGRKGRGGVSLSVYVALTNIPEGELLTGFAMRSDPKGFSEVFSPSKLKVRVQK